jgi:hypothetical protein
MCCPTTKSIPSGGARYVCDPTNYKSDEVKSKCAGLAQEIGFATAYVLS